MKEESTQKDHLISQKYNRIKFCANILRFIPYSGHYYMVIVNNVINKKFICCS